MRRVLVLALLLPLAGCLRTRIDLCAQVPPHEDCAALDAGRDAPGTDTPPDVLADTGASDAGAPDAPDDAPPPDAD